jgi:hypothetical protein
VTLDQFLLGLENVKHLGQGQWTASCPVPDHDDRHASLSVTAGEKGIVLHCHAGCSTEDVCRARGVELRDLFEDAPSNAGGAIVIPVARPAGRTATVERPAKARVSMPPAHIVEHWQARIVEVADRLAELKGWSLPTLQRLGVGFDGERVVFSSYVEGRLVGLVRYKPGHQPKTIAVGERHLWPAPESLSASHVWLVEGEPDAVSAAQVGLDAVAVPGVAIWKDDWAERFRGRTVTVCFDCDPEGRLAAGKRVRDLRAAGVEAAMVDLNPADVDGYDLSDALVTAVRENRGPDLCAYLVRLQNAAWAVVN